MTQPVSGKKLNQTMVASLLPPVKMSVKIFISNEALEEGITQVLTCGTHKNV